jgi:hypothetical protein
LIGCNLAFGRGRNLAFGRYELIELIMAFGHNELIEFTLAFGRNHKELIEPDDISLSNQLIVEYLQMQNSFQSHSLAQQNQTMPYLSAAYQTNTSTSSCPSTFQLVVASVVRLSNETSARVKHSSSNKSNYTSGFNWQFIVESNFEGAPGSDVAPDSISYRRRRRRRRCYRRPRHVRRSTLIVVFVNSKIFIPICKDCRIFREGVKDSTIGIVSNNVIDGRIMAFGRNLDFGCNLAFGRIMAFGRNELIELDFAFGRNLTYGHIMVVGCNELIELILAIGRIDLIIEFILARVCSFGSASFFVWLSSTTRLLQMTKYCVMRECENILRGYLCVFDLVFSHMMEFTVLNSQASFWILEISCRDLTSL